jgi:cytosine/adenosine deaminase-related metal-dependent hydrolase
VAGPPVWLTYRSRWLLTIDRPPIDNGWIAVVDGRIVEVGHGRAPSTAEDLGDVALMPGLVNAHTHLELSELAGRVPTAEAMVPWIRSMVAVRGRGSDPTSPSAIAAARDAIDAMAVDGTVLVGDISNSLMTSPLLATSALAGVVFHELIGFNRPDPAADVQGAWARMDAEVRDPLAGSVVAHAPYSVSPALFEAIAAARRQAPLAVHLGESRAEVEFLATGRGPFRELLEMFGVWTAAWMPPACDPAEYLDRLGYLQPGTLVVHGTHLGAAGLARLGERGAVLVTCPRSNRHVGEGTPPIGAFYASGVPVAIGTDSLASAPSLRMWDEIAAVRQAAPTVSPARILASATRVGAEALGFGADFGTIVPGKRAALVAVDLRGHADDVEEYLVSGVPAEAVRTMRA